MEEIEKIKELIKERRTIEVRNLLDELSLKFGELPKNIFDDIEKIIEKTKSDVPVPIKESRFIQELKKLKEKYEIK